MKLNVPVRFSAVAIVATATTVVAAAPAPPPPVDDGAGRTLTLWYDRPGTSAMNEGLPIGNGRFGGVVLGGTDRERIAFNDDSLWTGGLNPTGDYGSMGAYQAMGDLLLTTPAGLEPTVTCPSGQRPGNAAEDVAATVDGDAATKWCVPHGDRPVVWLARMPDAAPPVTRYTLTSANDVPARDPQTWELAGSPDGVGWTVLDRQHDRPPFARRGQAQTFRLVAPAAYRFYRLTVDRNGGDPLFQLAEVSLGTGPADAGGAGYRRELDLSTATATTTYVRGGVTFGREAFASATDGVVVVRWTASRPTAISGRIALRGAHHEASATTAGDGVAFGGQLDNGLAYAAGARVVATGGMVTAADGRVAVSGCDAVTIFLAGATNYAMDVAAGYRSPAVPADVVAGRLAAAAAKGYDALRADQQRDVASLFGRVTLDLGRSTDQQRAMPTNLRKAAAVTAFDPELEALLFQYGRYLLASCSRPGGLPANLQGLWNDSNRPEWSSDYHTNINVQMNYWPAEVANLAECHTPFFDLIRSQLDPWRAATAAAAEFRTPDGRMTPRGFALRTSHNTMGGMGWNWDDTANAWYCQHLWEHFAFGQDRAYLRDVAFPIMRETVGFWEDHLKAMPDGRLVVPHGWSPEHGPREDGCSYNQEIVWDLFNNYVDACNALGDAAPPGDRDRVTKLRDRLATPKVGRWGQLQEWMTDRDDPHDHHRHTSHLFGVFPGRQISVGRTPELARAAKVSLDARGTDANSDVREWSFAWRTALYARLGDGEQAHAMIQHLLADRNTCPNLFGLHPPMQLDGDFGVTAGMAEMLVQSHDGNIRLLPARPAAWATGHVTGLRARGGFAVDLAWADGRLTTAAVHGPAGVRCDVRYADRSARVTLGPDGQAHLGPTLAAVVP